MAPVCSSARSLWTLVAVCAAACPCGAQPRTFTPVVWDATVHLEIESHGEHRQYHVILPHGHHNNYSRQQVDDNNVTEADDEFRAHPPVIVMLHGAFNNASVFASTQTLTVAAGVAGYALLFPDGLADPTSVLPCHERSWNAGSCCGLSSIENVDDVGFIHAAITDAVKRFHLNKKHVFIAGASNGGSMAVRTVCELGGDVFAGAAFDVASIENVRGDACATRCIANASGDGYVYCTWDQERKGCTKNDWLGLPPLFECERRGAPVPVMFFNGNFDPFSSALIPGEKNNTGSIQYPVNPRMPGGYNTSFPPLSYATSHFAERINGCSAREPRVSFRNGTKGNMTICHTWEGCEANVTSCLSDAGHTWFGDFFTSEYSFGLCKYEHGGPPNDAICYPTPPTPGTPPPLYNTYSVNETAETLAFFRAAVEARESKYADA